MIDKAEHEDHKARLDVLVALLDVIVKDMREQIEHMRKHGDKWEADLLDDYYGPLNTLMEQYR